MGRGVADEQDGGVTAAVLVERRDGVVHLTLNRPEVGNALDIEAAETLLATLVALDPDDRVVHVTGPGKVFCAGGDVTGFAAADDVGAHVRFLAGLAHRVVHAVQDAPVPVVVTVTGAVGGVGLGLVAAADVVVCGPDVRFRPAYIGLGVTPDGGLTARLVRTLGRVRTLDLLMTDGVLSADEALAAGLVSRIAEDPVAESAAVVDRLRHGPTATYARLKRLVTLAADADLATVLDAEAEAIGAGAASPAGREGIAAFTQRRAPRWP